MTETCPERVFRDWYSYTCGRPVKGDGLCGIHLRAKRQREEGAAKRVVQRDSDNQLKADLAKLSEALGFQVSAHYPPFGSGYSHTTALVGIDDLKKLAERSVE